MIERLIVSEGGGVEEGGEGGGGREGSGGLVELGGGEADESVERAGEGAGGGDSGTGGGEGAGAAGALVSGALGDALKIGEEGGEVEVDQVDEGRLGQGQALLDGGDVGATVPDEEGKAEEGGGVTLELATLAGDETAGEGDRAGVVTEQVAEAGVAAMLEGVEVAFGGAGAGTRAAEAGLAWPRGMPRRVREERGR